MRETTENDAAVSPVISVILLLGLTVSLFAVASFASFDIVPDTQGPPDVKLSVNADTGNITVVSVGSDVERLELQGNAGEFVEPVEVGDGLDLRNAASTTTGVLATAGGEEFLVEQIELSQVEKPNAPAVTVDGTSIIINEKDATFDSDVTVGG